MLSASPQINTPADEPVDQSVLSNEAQSVGHMFRDRVAASPDRPAYLHAVVSPSGDEWVTVTWSELDVVVREIGAGLVALGIEPEDRVAISSSTRYEWALADLAVMVAGGATTTIYPTTIAEDVSFIISDSGAKVVFAENEAQLEKLRGIRAETPAVLRVIVFDGASDSDEWTLTLDEVRQLGREYLLGDPGAIDARIDGIQHDQLATIIYTSGTTGRPKGVRLRHSAWTYEGAAVDVDQHPVRGRPAVPLAAAGPRVRQGAAHPAAADRLPDGHRRADRQDRREPRRRQADLHGRRTAHLREGLRPHLDDDGRRGRREGQAVQLGQWRRP